MPLYSDQIGFAAGVMIGTSLTASPATPRRFGILQDATLDFSADLKELYGQKRYAIALAPGKTKVSIKAKFASPIIHEDRLYICQRHVFRRSQHPGDADPVR